MAITDPTYIIDFPNLQLRSAEVVATTSLKVGSNTLDGTEFAALDGVTAGTVTASKALIVDANKDLATLRHLTISGNLVTGSTTLSEAELGVLDSASNANSGTGKAAILGTSGAVTFAGAITPTGGVAASGGFSASPRLVHTGGTAPTQTTDGTDATPSATETYFAEIFIPANMSVTGAGIFNGSAVGTDKLVLILWDSAGNVLANTDLAGTTASGTDAYQKIAFTAPYAAKGPATYYLGMQCNGTTYRFNTHILGTFGANKATGTTFGTAPTITPPTTFTTALGPYMSLY